ncbi:MAG: LamG domain-containing protein, partial [Candidatus Cloacimonetes bacterium]|nr:LamG domain-containing protein [Candidatus Cloacimonadota bacterium]
MLDRRLAVDPNLVFNAPLRQLDGATFMSREQNGISCANNLALWRLNSLLWDGANSKIDCGHDVRIANIFDGGGTISAWINPKSDGEGNYGRIFDKQTRWLLNIRDEDSGAVKSRFFQAFNANDGGWTTNNRVISIGAWTHVAAIYDAGNVTNNPTIYINGIAYTVGDGLTEDETPIGTRISDTANTLYIGNSDALNRTFDGNMTDMRLYNRILSGIEILRIYNRTKRFFC